MIQAQRQLVVPIFADVERLDIDPGRSPETLVDGKQLSFGTPIIGISRSCAWSFGEVSCTLVHSCSVYRAPKTVSPISSGISLSSVPWNEHGYDSSFASGIIKKFRTTTSLVTLRWSRLWPCIRRDTSSPDTQMSEMAVVATCLGLVSLTSWR